MGVRLWSLHSEWGVVRLSFFFLPEALEREKGLVIWVNSCDFGRGEFVIAARVVSDGIHVSLFFSFFFLLHVMLLFCILMAASLFHSAP